MCSLILSYQPTDRTDGLKVKSSFDTLYTNTCSWCTHISNICWKSTAKTKNHQRFSLGWIRIYYWIPQMALSKYLYVDTNIFSAPSNVHINMTMMFLLFLMFFVFMYNFQNACRTAVWVFQCIPFFLFECLVLPANFR